MFTQPVYCGACEQTHILVLSSPIIPNPGINIRDKLMEVTTFMAGSVKPTASSKPTESIPSENTFEIYYTCPVENSVQCISIIPKDPSNGNNIQVLGLLDQEISSLSQPTRPQPTLPKSIAPQPSPQVISTFVGYQKEISIMISKKDPNKEIEFRITNSPKHGKIEEPISGTGDISDTIIYSATKASIDYIDFEVYYKGAPKVTATKGTITVIVNNVRSYFPGPEREQIVQYSKDLITTSIEKLKDFTRFVVPTVSAVISVHIGLFAFFGLEKITQFGFLKTLWYVSPIFPLVLSLFLFHYAILPSIQPIRIGNLDNVIDFRASVLRELKNKTTYAFVLFSIGLALMGITLIPPPDTQTDQDIFHFLRYENPRFNYQIEYPEFWNVLVLDSDQIVVFKQLGLSNSPSVKIFVGAFVDRPNQKDFAFEIISQLGDNTSTPIPDRLGNVNTAYSALSNNNTLQTLRVVAMDDSKKNFFIFDYTATKLDYDLYFKSAIEKMKNSFSVKPQDN